MVSRTWGIGYCIVPERFVFLFLFKAAGRRRVFNFVLLFHFSKLLNCGVNLTLGWGIEDPVLRFSFSIRTK